MNMTPNRIDITAPILHMSKKHSANDAQTNWFNRRKSTTNKVKRRREPSQHKINKSKKSKSSSPFKNLKNKSYPRIQPEPQFIKYYKNNPSLDDNYKYQKFRVKRLSTDAAMDSLRVPSILEKRTLCFRYINIFDECIVKLKKIKSISQLLFKLRISKTLFDNQTTTRI